MNAKSVKNRQKLKYAGLTIYSMYLPLDADFYLPGTTVFMIVLSSYIHKITYICSLIY